ncbi:unnamed protein product [Rotaria sp. Silwood2]|nr:unnamed protein product [Rotaria sp. Silwood2]CAF4240727.1 unnamed protein product [Rotaria sp. Silwood2]
MENMQDPMEMENEEDMDPSEYARLQEEYEEKLDEFMRKHLRRIWPVCVVRLLGIFQLLVTLIILGVDLPIILMFAPRWQVFAGCWASVLGFIASVSTIHSSRQMTWSKLKWAAGLNILGGLAIALMIAFDILYLVNSKVCIVISGCNYLSYTYSAVRPYYTVEVVMGFVFLVLFIKHGIGGSTLFENIQRGWAPPIYKPIEPPNSTMPMPQNPMARPGMMMPPPPPGSMPMPQNSMARPGMMMRPPPPPGSMPPYQAPIPGAMMPRPGMPMMMSGARYPPMQEHYRQPGPYAALPRPYLA